MANQHGGARPGSGRKPGSVTQKTREIAERAIKEGLTPLEYMLAVMRDEVNDTETRMDAAKSAAPYLHPRLNAITVAGDDDAPLRHVFTWEAKPGS
jgi:hypothetical protein